MADFIEITQTPVLVQSAPQMQPLWQAIDVSKYDFLDVHTGIIGVQGNVTACVIDLFTGTQLQTEDYSPCAQPISTAVTYDTFTLTKNVTGLLKYVRWRVSTLTGGGSV